jgi:hypothetical protein
VSGWRAKFSDHGGSITVRVILGAGLLLASTTLVGLPAPSAQAATGCDNPDNTTWTGPAEGGSWAEPTNWDKGGVPTAESIVCIPTNDDGTGPHVLIDTDAAADVIDATGATVTLSGTLSVGTLDADGGTLVGGTTTVTDTITGPSLRLRGSAVVDLSDGAVVSGELSVGDGSRLNVVEHAALTDGAWIDSLDREDPGLFTITETGSLTLDGTDMHATVTGGFANHGQVTVTTDQRLLMMGAAPEDADPDQFSTGTFTGAPHGLFNVAYAELRTGARLDDVMADHIAVPGGNTVRLGDGSLITGDVIVGGRLEADLGPTGTATIEGAEVTGEVIAYSGTLSVPSLAPTTLQEDGTLTQGRWVVWPGATLDLPSVTTNDAWLQLLSFEGSVADGSFGDGLATLSGIGPNGTLILDGNDLAVPGRFRNEGVLLLGSSRLDVGGKFRQLATGTLWINLDSARRGRVRAAGPRDLAGGLWVERDPAYEPPVGTVLNVITSNGRVTADDAFDRVRSPRYDTRKLRVAYGTNHVRLRVDRVG